MSTPKEHLRKLTQAIEQSSIVTDARRMYQKVRNIVRSIAAREKTALNPSTKEPDKDKFGYNKRILWQGNWSEFLSNQKMLPESAILRELPGGENFAFRAISNAEFEHILQSRGIGGDGYQGTVIQDGTLFGANLGAPLSMFDGKSYGPGDDRHRGGYIIAIKKVDLFPYTDSPPTDPTYLVTRKIPVEKIYKVFRVDRKEPRYSSPEDTLHTYTISQIFSPPKI